MNDEGWILEDIENSTIKLIEHRLFKKYQPDLWKKKEGYSNLLTQFVLNGLILKMTLLERVDGDLYDTIDDRFLQGCYTIARLNICNLTGLALPFLPKKCPWSMLEIYAYNLTTKELYPVT